MEYGYARCSTNSDKQDIDRQKRELMLKGIRAENIFWEYGIGEGNARAKGKHIGRNRNTIEDIPQSFFRYYPMFSKGGINLSEFARLTGLSRNSIYKYLRIVEQQ